MRACSSMCTTMATKAALHTVAHVAGQLEGRFLGVAMENTSAAAMGLGLAQFAFHLHQQESRSRRQRKIHGNGRTTSRTASDSLVDNRTSARQRRIMVAHAVCTCVHVKPMGITHDEFVIFSIAMFCCLNLARISIRSVTSPSNSLVASKRNNNAASCLWHTQIPRICDRAVYPRANCVSRDSNQQKLPNNIASPAAIAVSLHTTRATISSAYIEQLHAFSIDQAWRWARGLLMQASRVVMRCTTTGSGPDQHFVSQTPTNAHPSSNP